jgi:hypothetical protein
MNWKTPVVRATHTAAFVVLALALVPVALAGKGGGGTKPGGGGAGSSSLSLVMVNQSDTVANWGDQVTFNVTSSATAFPSVELDCYQNGTVVYTHSAGFYPSYPWPQDQIFNLKSYVWTSGEADCTAKLYYMNSKGGSNTLATITFRVAA